MVTLQGGGRVFYLERGAWSMAKRPKQATKKYPPQLNPEPTHNTQPQDTTKTLHTPYRRRQDIHLRAPCTARKSVRRTCFLCRTRSKWSWRRMSPLHTVQSCRPADRWGQQNAIIHDIKAGPSRQPSPHRLRQTGMDQ